MLPRIAVVLSTAALAANAFLLPAGPAHKSSHTFPSCSPSLGGLGAPRAASLPCLHAAATTLKEAMKAAPQPNYGDTQGAELFLNGVEVAAGDALLVSNVNWKINKGVSGRRGCDV